MSRYEDWLRQAVNDLDWAEHSMKGGFFAQTCFSAQQAAEKALKAYCFFKGIDIIRTHSLFQIIRTLGENGPLERTAKELDFYYISGRYPDAFPGGAPFELFNSEQAAKALIAAHEIVDQITGRLPEPR